MSDWWTAGHAKWPLPLSFTVYGVPHVVFATGTPAGISGVGGIVSRALSSRHVGTPFEDVAFTACPFGYCLVSWADRPPPQDGSESAPFRPIPTVGYGCSCKRWRWKLDEGVQMVVVPHRVGFILRLKTEVFASFLYKPLSKLQDSKRVSAEPKSLILPTPEI